MEWQEYFSEELKVQEKEHYYLAQLACEVRRSFTKDPKSVKIEDFLIKFKDSAPATKAQKDTNLSKSIWMGLAKAMEKGTIDVDKTGRK